MLQRIKRDILWLAPLLAATLGYTMFKNGWQIDACLVAALTLVCALWWMFEAIPIPATSLIPLALFPLLGLLTPSQIASSYGSPLILLMLGGAMLSKAMEKSGAHRRIALGIINILGNHSERRLVIGFMAASAILSMWISNTATTLMLLPIAMAALEKVEDRRLIVAMLLGIAYAASIGGLGTPIGTPANVIMMEVYASYTNRDISFLEWMMLTMPIVIILVPIIGLWLCRDLRHNNTTPLVQLPIVGKWCVAEKRVLAIFVITALAWMTLKNPYGGWGQWLPHANYGAVALLAVLILFIANDGQGGKLLDWESANKIQWGVLLLFAGGIAIAKAFQQTGLSAAMGEAMSGFALLPVLLLIALLVLCVTFLTEITSNTATATLLMPIMAAAAIGNDMNPKLFMLPAVLSTSCAFMLPVATPPNAIVFGTNKIQISDMVRHGFVTNLIAAMIIIIVCYLLYAGGVL